MPEEHSPLLTLIRQADEARQCELDRLAPRCDIGPSLAAMYLYVSEGIELPTGNSAHLQSCATCSCTLESVNRHLAASRLDHDAAGDNSPLRPERVTKSARRKTAPVDWLQSAIKPVVRHWRAAIGSLAAAAVIVFAVVAFFQHTPLARADLYADAANAGAPALFFMGSIRVMCSDDPEACARHQSALADAENRFRAAKAGMERVRSVNSQYAVDVMSAWQTLYCQLRAMGDIEKSIEQNKHAIAYARGDNPAGVKVGNWEAVHLDGLANTLAAAGDYDQARQVYDQVLVICEAEKGDPRDPHLGQAGYEGHLMGGLVPNCLRHVMLGIAQRDLPHAWQWQHRADHSMSDLLRTICELNGRSDVDASASLWELWNTLPADFRRLKRDYTEQERAQWPVGYVPYAPSEGYFHWIGAILYHEAVLQRLARDYAAAASTLERAATLEPFLTQFPDNDEYRLPLLLNIERARLAIAQKHYSLAAASIDTAEQYLRAVQEHYSRQATDQSFDPRFGGALVHKLPLSPARNAELALLRGVALLGQNPDDPQGRGLVERAYRIVVGLARGLPPETRERFLDRFADWRDLFEATKPTTMTGAGI